MADFTNFVTRISDPTKTVAEATGAGTGQMDGLLYSIARDRGWTAEPTAQLQAQADQFNQAQRDFVFAMGQPSQEEYNQISATTFSPAGPDQSWITYTDKLGEADMNAFNSIVQNADNASSASGRFQAYDALAQAVYGQGWESLNDDQQRNVQITMSENHPTFALQDRWIAAQAGSVLMDIASRYTNASESVGPQAGIRLTLPGGLSIDTSMEGRLRREISSRTNMSDEQITHTTQYGMLQSEYNRLTAGGGDRWEGETSDAYSERQRRLGQVQDQMTQMQETSPDVVATYWANAEAVSAATQEVTGGRYTTEQVLVGGTLRRAQANAVSELTELGLTGTTAQALVGGGTVDTAALSGLTDEAIAALPPNVQAALKSARTNGTLPSDFNIADLAAIGGGDFSLLGRESTSGNSAPTVRTGQTMADATYVNVVAPEGGLPVTIAGFNPASGGSNNNYSTTPTPTTE
jgi:hypothetical protein